MIVGLNDFSPYLVVLITCAISLIYVLTPTRCLLVTLRNERSEAIRINSIFSNNKRCNRVLYVSRKILVSACPTFLIVTVGNSFFQDDVSKKAREENGKDYLGKHYYTADIERYKDTDRYEYFKIQIKREGMGLKGQKPLKEKAVIDYLILQGKIKVLT